MFAKPLFRQADAHLRRTASLTQIDILKKHHMKEYKEFLARGQKDERSRQESRLESFQKQGKLPADNVKAKGITKKLLNTSYHGIVYHPGDTY